MKKIYRIAVREFVSTVSSRGYIFGLLVFPVIMGTGALVFPKLFNSSDITIKGEVAVIDHSGTVTAEIQSILEKGMVPDIPANAGNNELARTSRNIARQVMDRIIDIRLVKRPVNSDLGTEKMWLLENQDDLKPLALIVIHTDAANIQDDKKGYGTYDLYVPPNLSNRAEFAIKRIVQGGIINARMQALDIDRRILDTVMRVKSPDSVTVSREGEQKSEAVLRMILPMAFMMLMFVGIMGGGTSLLTSTVEEKSSRVIEVLLSAVSPMELMAGKLLGQVTASLLALSVYIFMGIAFLVSFSLLGMVNLNLIFYLLVFFLISYFVIGSLMMAVGAAVNETSEAQSLQLPLMLVISLPWILWFPVSQNPESTISVVTSLLPPINTFVMLLRMASTVPPPMWQVWLTIIIGIASIYVALWFAAKVFRIGLLMHGKPPDFATLFRWVRAS